MNSACIVYIAGGLEGLRPSKKNPRMHALLQEIILYGTPQMVLGYHTWNKANRFG
jgi:hypothetical protein